MQKRPRIKSPIFTAKADGTLIRREKINLSTHGRIKLLLSQLGPDAKQILTDIRWANTCRQASLL